jgi:hypothetical protein
MLKPNLSVWRPGTAAASLFLYLCAASLFATGLISMTSGKPGLARLILLGISILLSGGLCGLGWLAQKNIDLTVWWQEHIHGKTQMLLIVLFALIFAAGWCLIWTPLENFEGLYYYLMGVYPFIIWLTCSSAIALILLLASRYGLNIRQWLSNLQNRRVPFIVAAGALIIFALIAWAASFRVVGVKPVDEDFWYGAGVPVLAFQVLAALFIGVGLSALISQWLKSNPARSTWINLLLFLLIWALSAWLWAKEPVKPDFLVSQPVAPNFEMYPDYDARNYDLMSQYALIGQGINNHYFFDRVLYPAFITYLHSFIGQDYERLMDVQAALFAVLPALLFLMGTSLYNRAGGVSLGILAALRGVNQISIGNIIETAHQKHMLTEYPTAVLLVLATLLLVKWVQNPNKNWVLAGLAGGIIGLSTLLRPHTLIIIPVFFILAFLVYRHRTRIWLGMGTLFIAAALLSVIPWLQFGGQNISIFDLYATRVRDVIRQRYPQLLSPQGLRLAPITENSQDTLHLALYHPNSTPEKTVIAFATDNFLNNLVTSVQTLPTTPFNLDARSVVKKTENFWKPNWDGSLSGWAKLLLPFNILILAIGLGAAWKRARISGLVPLIVMLSYFGMNAFGRTSGGRYLVPADWVVLVYYILGLVTILELVPAFFVNIVEPAKIQVETSSGTPLWRGVLIILLVPFAIGSLIPLAQQIYPQRFPERSQTEQASLFLSIAGGPLGLSSESLQSFLATENAVILTGRSLYPRQFIKDEGLNGSVYNFYHKLPYPRTLFTVIGKADEKVIILPRRDPAPIPNSTDVMVLGCQADGFVQAWAVIRLDDNSIMERTPSSPALTCPLPEPICDNNKSCH